MLLLLLFPVILSVPTLAQNEKIPQELLNKLYLFDIDLLQIHSSAYTNNWIISPLSIKTTLGLLLEGTSKSTALEICKRLGMAENVTAARNIMRELQKKLERPPEKITVKSGTTMLVKQGLGIIEKFRNDALDYYSAKISASNFNNPEYVSKELNKWIKNATNGHISEILSPDSMSPDAVMLLANAVFFKAKWEVDFNTVTNGCFYVPHCTEVKMMGTSGAFKYGEIKEDKARIIEIPYENPRYSMIILIPHEKSSLVKTAWSLRDSSFIKILDDLLPMNMELVIPKFSIEFNHELKTILHRLGITEIFSDSADFSELFHLGTKAQISSFAHRAKIEVTEKGTLAAGTSVAQFQLLSTNNKPKIVIDRPFFFFVRDLEAGFLFTGQLADAYAAQAQGNPLKIVEVSDVNTFNIRKTSTSSPWEKVETRSEIVSHPYPFSYRNNYG